MRPSIRIRNRRTKQEPMRQIVEDSPRGQNTKRGTSGPIQFSKEKEEEYEQYAQNRQSNPSNITFSNKYMPHSASLFFKNKVPLGCQFYPVCSDVQPFPGSASKIPRCEICKAYMNYYNSIQGKKFRCFICGNQSHFSDYDCCPENPELTYHSYQVMGDPTYFKQTPPQDCFIFLVDLNSSSYECRMLQYMVTVLKEILAREQYDDYLIYFYCYDEVVYEYDFSGSEVKCIVVDGSIEDTINYSPQCMLSNIREKLFVLLDSLEQMSKQNKRQGSNLHGALQYTIKKVKHTGGQIHLFQCNDAMVGEAIFQQKKVAQVPKCKSALEPKNKAFLNFYAKKLNEGNLSLCWYGFSRHLKNMVLVSDTLKTTSSSLYFYCKDIPQDLSTFYYELYNNLGTVWYKNVNVESIICPSWYFTCMFSKGYRIKNNVITFHYSHYHPSKVITTVFQPQEAAHLNPYFAIQFVTNYYFHRQHYMSVTTAVVPFTSSLAKLYDNVDLSISAAIICRMCSTSIRTKDSLNARNEIIKIASNIYKSALQHFKKKVDPNTQSLCLRILAFLKSSQNIPDLLQDSLQMDTLLAERFKLMDGSISQINNYFNPYLFNLSSMDKNACKQDQDFIYPEVCPLRFSSVVEGIYLMDSGLTIYLYVAKKHNPAQVKALFGSQKLRKEIMNQDIISQQTSLLSAQVITLLRVLRQQKSSTYAPLHVVRCGENSFWEKSFYLNFYEEKYDEYRVYKGSIEEFLQMLAKNY